LRKQKNCWCLSDQNQFHRSPQNAVFRTNLTSPECSPGQLALHPEPGGGNMKRTCSYWIETNWLPVPNGPLLVALRMYWPTPETLNGQWKCPDLQRIV
jgi:hypothetical protein